MIRSPNIDIDTRSSFNLISNRDAGYTKGRHKEETEDRGVDDEDTTASLKAFHMSL